MRAGQVYTGGIHCSHGSQVDRRLQQVRQAGHGAAQPCHTAPTLPHHGQHWRTPRLRPSPAMNFSLAVGVPSRITRCMRDQGPCRGREAWGGARLGAENGSCGASKPNLPRNQAVRGGFAAWQHTGPTHHVGVHQEAPQHPAPRGVRVQAVVVLGRNLAQLWRQREGQGGQVSMGSD